MTDHPEDEICEYTDFSMNYIYGHFFHRTELMKEIISMSDSITEDDICIFFHAVTKINYELINKLIDKRMDLNKKYVIHHLNHNNSLYPLEAAVIHEDINLCHFLIQNGCDTSIDNNRLLFVCLCKCDSVFLSYFIAYYPDVNVIIPYLNDSDLYDMKFENFKILINTGLQIDKIDVNKSSLYSCIVDYETDRVQYIINNGLIITNSLLYYAATNFDDDMVKYLLQCGLMFDKNIVYDILFDAGKYYLNYIDFLINYECDWSLVKEENVNNYCTIMKNNNVDPEFLLNLILTNMRED